MYKPVKMKRSLVEQCVILPDELTTNALRGGWFHDHYNTYKKGLVLKNALKMLSTYLHHQQSSITRTQKYDHWVESSKT